MGNIETIIKISFGSNLLHLEYNLNIFSFLFFLFTISALADEKGFQPKSHLQTFVKVWVKAFFIVINTVVMIYRNFLPCSYKIMLFFLHSKNFLQKAFHHPKSFFDNGYYNAIIKTSWTTLPKLSRVLVGGLQLALSTLGLIGNTLSIVLLSRCNLSMVVVAMMVEIIAQPGLISCPGQLNRLPCHSVITH